MFRRPLLALPLVAATAACAEDPALDYLGGIGDPVRGAALNAPRMLTDLSQYAGRPAEAARAAVQLEFLADRLPNDPYWFPQISPTLPFQLREARSDLRAALGIAPDAPPDLVIDSLRTAAAALDAGRPARAEAALTSPAFRAGPQGTLARLGSLPRIYSVAVAAGAVAGEIGNPGPTD